MARAWSNEWMCERSRGETRCWTGAWPSEARSVQRARSGRESPTWPKLNSGSVPAWGTVINQGRLHFVAVVLPLSASVTVTECKYWLTFILSKRGCGKLERGLYCRRFRESFILQKKRRHFDSGLCVYFAIAFYRFMRGLQFLESW
jgi:hypothetical protein